MSRPPKLSAEQLFRPGGPTGLLEISDATLDLRLDEADRRSLARQSDAGYQAAVAEEMLSTPEST